ncbi:hypothetical protein [Nonomuraea angiospora]
MSELAIRLVPPSWLVGTPVNYIYLPRGVEIRIDRTSGTDPDLIAELTTFTPRALQKLAEVIDPENPPPVRYHLTGDVDLLGHDFEAEQADMYINKDLMRQDIADCFSALATHFVRTRMTKEQERGRWLT